MTLNEQRKAIFFCTTTITTTTMQFIFFRIIVRVCMRNILFETVLAQVWRPDALEAPGEAEKGRRKRKAPTRVTRGGQWGPPGFTKTQSAHHLGVYDFVRQWAKALRSTVCKNNRGAPKP